MDGLDPNHVEASFVTLEKRAADELKNEGLGDEQAQFLREMDLRYAGQGYELRIPLDGIPAPVNRNGLEDLVERFHERHQAVHGHAARGADVEAVSYRLRAVVAVPKLEIAERPPTVGGGSAPTGTRIISDGSGNQVAVQIWRRADLPPDLSMKGPIIVEQLDSTTVVPAGWSVRCDAHGNLELTRDGRA